MNLVYLFLLLLFAYHLRSSNAGSSLRKSKLLSFEKCKNPDPPLDEKSQEKIKEYVITYTEKGRLLIKGNATLYQDIIAQAAFKSGVERANKKFQYRFELKKMSCKNVITKLVLTSLMKFNPKNCVVSKGVYTFENLDIAKIESAVNFVPVREAGVHRWYFGFYGPEGTYVCFDIRILVE